jgi:hypothetical protein
MPDELAAKRRAKTPPVVEGSTEFFALRAGRYRDAWLSARNRAAEAYMSRESWPSKTSTKGLDPEALNELALLISGDGWVPLTIRYGAAARILNAGWTPPAARVPAEEDGR